jgi:hypothetical protein
VKDAAASQDCAKGSKGSPPKQFMGLLLAAYMYMYQVLPEAAVT